MTNEAKLREYLKRATADLSRAQRRLGEVEAGKREPIAILGMACRYPGGVSSPAELWDLLAEGKDGISQFPADRGWDLERLYHPDPDNPGTTYSTRGGFLADPGDFDAEFFGVSPREALATDPQQRLLLEASWEALEAAGIDPASLRGEPAGVFAGVMGSDYAIGLTRVPEELEGYMGTGVATSAASGRISYVLGLEGPAMTIDTACSSSLVAIHLAAQALRGGECSLALAGGVSVLATPGLFTELSRQRGLAPDGRCKSFAEAADGAGFSEGIGMLALQRLSDAQRQGHPVLALLKGSAVNQDGASNGLSSPNGPSQERVIRQALANARLAPKDVELLEAHGTGTALGDPIEAGALLATYGQERDKPLKLGSIKSNIGHAQAAAGVAGVIKAVLAIREGVMPKTLHIEEPSSHVEWSEGQIELLREAEPWERNGQPRRAGVSSFGMSGTNAHVILEGAPEPAGEAGDLGQGSGAPSEAAQPLPGPVPLTLSAKSEQALHDQAERLSAHLKANPDLDPTDLAYSLATTRSSFAHRAVLVGGDREELLGSLVAIAQGKEAPGIARGLAKADQNPVFLFPGYGAQWQGMGAELLDRSPTFAAKAGECIEAFEPYVDWSLLDALGGTEGARSVNDPDVGSLVLFTMMVSLAELWRSCGVRPAAVLGHSQGEVAAAHVAGALSLDDAARVTAIRTGAFQRLVGKGAMASLALPAEQLKERLGQWEGRLELAAINGPSSTVVSGDIEPLDELLAQCEQEGLQARKVSGAIAASHSAQFEVLREEVLEGLAQISPQSGDVPFHSTVTGELLDTKELDAEYWYRNLRQPVRFEAVTKDLLAQGQRSFLEISPHPVLAFAAEETIEDALGEEEATYLPTLRRDEGTPERFCLSLAGAHAAGAKVEWEAFFKASGAKRVPLPTYPFQRKRYWLDSTMGGGDAGAIGLGDPEHPLLGAALEDPSGEGLTLTGRLSLATHPWLADHAAAGTVLLPGTAFLELALSAGERVGAPSVEELTIAAPLILTEGAAVALQVKVGSPEEEGRREVSVHSRPEAQEEAEWVRHAQGALLPEQGQEAPLEPPGTWPPQGAEPLELEFLYDRLAEMGLEYGPAFQGLHSAWQEGETIYAEASLPQEQANEAQRFALHPALLDSALHAVALGAGAGMEPRLPFAWSEVSLQSVGAQELRLRLEPKAEGTVSISLFDAAGEPMGRVGSLAARPLDPSLLKAAGQGDQDGLLAIEWRELPAGEPLEFTEISNLSDLAGQEDAEVSAAVLWRVPREEGADPPANALALTATALEQIQAWLADERLAETRLAILTEGAGPTGEEEPPDLPAASLWGLLRSAQTEHPERFVLLDTDGSEASAEAIGAALSLEEEPQLAIREGKVLVPRAAPVPVPDTAEEQRPSLDPDKTVLITGATGGLGSLVARHLVEAHGARHLLLASRSGAKAEGAGELLAQLEELGAKAKLASCDVSDPTQLKKLVAQIPKANPLGAVFHCAGALDDATIASLSPEQIERAFAPKANAAWCLHELSEATELSAFVLFSSAAGALGAPGQGGYAAANSFLDALATHRRAKGLAATSIAWGQWQRESAMSAHLGEADLARVARTGMAPLSDEQGLELLDRAIGSGVPATIALSLQPTGLRAQAQAGLLPALFSSLVRVPTRRRQAASSSLAAKLAGLGEAEREAHVLELVRSEVATVLGHETSAQIEPERAFMELGFDSLAAVELRNRLRSATGLRLAATVVFDYPNAKALAGHLLAEATAKGAKQVAVRAQATDEPIAILGMACRYPGGVSSPAELWDLLAEGKDGISQFPADRGWDLERLYHPDPEHPGTSYANQGGFLAAPGDFDAEFFGVSPREALATDPQQRLLLEASWEALEAAGIDPASLRGEPAGVFAGVMGSDYAIGLTRVPEELEGYMGTGVATSAASGRISYVLGLEGPAMTIDTACSSSLVAIHLAAQALRGGECTLALAGGVTAMSTPGSLVGFSRQRGLSADGRCKAFAEGADGIGVSEGVGVLTLARLSDAQRQGHPVLALLKGSAVNQDGASNGLAAPNGPSQERVIRQALANARLAPKDVELLEAHGTGTALGDPIEAGALLATYGQERDKPLKLGSIKSNIGHAQAAAGVAGVIKAVLAMREGVMPKTLHIDEPSSHVEWSEGQIELLREAEPWERNGQPRRAGVSSFGMSGTNAHVILEGAPEPAGEAGDLGQGSGAPSEAAQPLPGPVPLTLSAKSEEALTAQAERLATHLKDNPDLDPTDLAYSLATTRSAFAHRAVAIASSREQALSSLSAVAAGEEAPGIARGLAKADQNPVFLFPGQGSQWQGMGAELLDRSPSFARHMDECEEALSPHLDFSVREVLTGESEEWLERIDVVQPALFAVMVSLARLWEELGVKPAAVLGHSQGEIAAAHLAGGLSLDDAARIVALRAKAMAKIAGKGAMLSVSLSPKQLAPRLEPFGERVSLAAINGPASLVLSGEPESLAELQGSCEQDGVRAQRIAVDYAAHSAQIDDLREELLEAFSPISPQSGHVPFHSTVTGELLDTKELDAEYWYRNLRQPVRFEAVTKDLLAQGQRSFLEISPHPVLAFAAEETIEDALGEEEATYLPTLRRDEGTPERFCLSLAGAHAAGAKVEWEAFFKASGAKRVPLPTYPFQRKRYWLDSTMGGGDAGAIGLGDPEHPLLGAALEDPSGEGLTLTGRLSLATHPWLADHAAAGTVLLPGTAFLELALSAGERVGAPSVEELTIAAPLILTEGAAVALQVKVGSPEEEGRREVSVHSRPEAQEEAEWVRHAQGALLPEQGQEAPLEPPGTWPPQGAEPLELEFLYDRLAEMGLEYGPAFQGLHSAWQEGETIYAEASLPQEQANEAQRFALHPALLDSALHAVALSAGAGMEPRLPFAWSEVSLQSVGAQELRLRLEPKAEGTVSISLFDAAGEPMGRVGSLAARPLDPSLLKAAGQGDQDGLLAIEWRELPAGEPLEFTEISNLSDLAGQEDAEVSAAVLWRVPREEGADPPANALALTATALEQIQAWLADERLAETRLAILTEGAVASSGEEDPDLPAASLWGLLRSAQTEHPERFVLLDTDGSEASAEAIGAALSLEEEPQLAIREGKVLVPRAAPVPVPDTAEEQRPSLDPDKTVLITGATGGLGSLVARHLVEAHGARHLLLASRSGAKAEGAGELLAQLEELGAKAKLASCDVSDPTQLKKLVAQIPKANPLGAVFHCAGALDDATIASLSPEQIERAFAPKANAAWCLHELSEATELSAFVLFSSAAGALGAPGQGGYAAANSFLDALATHRRAKGLAATSIAWGQWQRESAMSAHLGEADLARVARTGMAPLSDEQGLELLDRAIGSGVPATIALSLQPTGLRAQAQAGLLPALFSSLVRVPTRRRQAASSSLAAKLAGLGEAEREAHVLELVRSEVATVLGHETSAQIEPERAFMELGFDSLAAVELRNRLRSATGLRLAATVVFDYPNAKALAGHLLAEATAKGAKQVAVRAQATDEPIAILGMACRYPGGVSSPAELWDLLAEGKDGISQFPADRGWDLERLYHPDPEHPGTSYANQGGFLAAPGDFDAEFFGVSPREALATDPQQRLLLEASWEALEAAGIDPASLRGEPAGVFAGVMGSDYAIGLTRVPEELEGYMGTGVATSAASGRISYVLGLEGPAMTIDTACSSSLVAIHLAAQALRGGECSLALAGGVSVLATPGLFTELSRQRGLAPDGRCKSFAEAADGAGFSEGIGMLALQRLSDAQRQGHPVLALLKGSAVNQDGASNGLSSPNGPSQERVIRQALANARLAPKDVELLEAHGTGTALGDPIEAGALLATYGQERDKPLKLGSIKSNIGHAQAAAGVAGVIKAVLAIREGVMPKTLHIEEPSSHVEWSEGQIELLREAEPWERNGQPRRAGVSSFGASGTNAHVILEGAPEPAGEAGDLGQGSGAPSEAAQPLPGPVPLTLSAKSEQALTAQAERLASHLKANPDLDPTDLAYSLATTRSSFAHRAVLVGGDREELLGSLVALAQGKEAPGTARAIAKADQNPVFLFPGYGAQWQGMGAELLDRSPTFAAKAGECIEAFEPYVDWSLLDALGGTEGARSVNDPDVGSLVLFTMMVSLAELWRSCGVRPAAVLGHSQGEVAAAHVAGALSLDDAARVTAIRTGAFQRLVGKGAMASLALPAEQLKERLGQWEGRLELAAINGPSSTVVSGDIEPLDELLAQCEQEGLQARKVSGAIAASHSAQFEVLREEVLEGLAQISPQSGDVPFHSTVTGELLDTKELGPEYWFRNMRQTVLLEPVARGLIEKGHATLVEVSSHPVLAIGLQETAEAAKSPASISVLPTLKRDEGTPERFCLSLAGAHAAGAKVEWEAFFKASSAKRVALPTYPFQRKRYWLDSTMGGGDAGAIGLGDPEHPLLGASVSLAGSERRLLTGRLSLATHPWLADHAAAGTVLLPGTAFLELALRAGEEVGCETVEELALRSPLLVPEKGAVALQVAVSDPDERGRREIEVHSRPEGDVEDRPGEWVLHAGGTLGPKAAQKPEPLGAWPPPGAQSLDTEALYERLADAGIEYGPAFGGLSGAWQEGETIYAEVSLPEAQLPEAARCAVHPALLEAALAAIGAPGQDAGAPRLPTSFATVSAHGGGVGSLRLRLRAEGERAALEAFDEKDAPLLSGTVAMRELDPAQLAAARSQRSLYRLRWTAATPPVFSEEAPHLAILGEGPPEGLEAQSYPDLAALEEAIGAGTPAPDVVLVNPRESQGEDVPGAARAAAIGALELAQSWLSSQPLGEARLAFLTERAIAAGEGEDPDLATAPLWGLLRSACSEHPGRFSLLDLDGGEASLRALPGALAAGEAEPQLALREGELLAPRLARAQGEEPPGEPIDPERTVLIAGAGEMGALLARHLVQGHGARHLVLASRRGAEAPGAAELTAELEERGASVTLASCDLCDRSQVEDTIASIPAEHPLGAVIHAATVRDDGLLESLDAERLQRAMRPKVDAAWHLHELTEQMELSQFVLCSSTAGILGTPAQANHAAANSFLDALAHRRRAQGLPAISIAWGRPGELTESLFDTARALPEPLLIATELKGTELRERAEAGILPPILRDLAPARGESQGATLAQRLAGVPEAEREEVALELVREHVAAVLGHSSPGEVDPDRAFQELGFDSLGAVELRNRLSVASGLRLNPTLVFDYPTVRALAGYMVAEVAVEGTADSARDRAGKAIAEIEATLSSVAEDRDREWVVVRLRALLESSLASAPSAADAESQDLGSMSNEEMFALIDQELGEG